MNRLNQEKFEEILSDSPSAIAVFAYNRPAHFQDCLNSLARNDNFEKFRCYLFVDGPKKGNDFVANKKIIETSHQFQKNFKNITLHVSDINLGLRKSVISGISKVLTEYHSIIVVEDDLVVSPDFLNFMQIQLSQYRDNPKVGSIAGFKENWFPPFFIGDTVASARQSCWGWATWKDRWEQVTWGSTNLKTFEFEATRNQLNKIGSDLGDIYEAQQLGTVNSWAIDFDAAAARLQWKSIHPRFSLVQNNGRDGSGTHYAYKSNGRNKVLTLKEANNKIGIAKSSAVYDFTLRLKFSRVSRRTRRVFSLTRHRLNAIANK